MPSPSIQLSLLNVAGDDGAVVVSEWRLDDGDKGDFPAAVAGSDAFVDDEARFDSSDCSGSGISALATSALVGTLGSETPETSSWNTSMAGALRGLKICDGLLGKGDFEYMCVSEGITMRMVGPGPFSSLRLEFDRTCSAFRFGEDFGDDLEDPRDRFGDSGHPPALADVDMSCIVWRQCRMIRLGEGRGQLRLLVYDYQRETRRCSVMA